MKENEVLAYFLEHLWSKGFKLSDEEVQFIYFGKKYTNTSVHHVKLAISLTLQLQLSFDRSFYISLLELFQKNEVRSLEEAKQLLMQHQLIHDSIDF
ncbi:MULTISPECIES: DUF6123 family protein [Gracilibacillus]|uniref:Uncharacterized protein n=1 Tax=Gracilibacillus dipsosauri TaxID=178340 RepID=A0A317L4E6_9BACI|nr:DUF6123 family protein [Gracilibacillus dipsosauri]PWU68679.1 hypothetical protein DLJ74_09630 [Gracilibacillus dipsosauri]